MRVLFVLAVLVMGACVADAEPPRTLLKGNARILGRVVEELVLSDLVQVGTRLPPGLPTTIRYKMAPNRFRAVAEDTDGVFYQAVGPLQKFTAMQPGGVYVSKQYPDQIIPYLGDAGSVRLPLMILEPLSPADVRRFRVRFAAAKGSR